MTAPKHNRLTTLRDGQFFFGGFHDHPKLYMRPVEEVQF